MADTDSFEALRQQFDSAPYPKVALDFFPKDDYNFFFTHNLVTPYYLRYGTVASTENRLILDAGCGSGFKALMLAEANPGARIVGVDLSEQSVNLARQRLHYHGFENAEFHAMPIEALPDLGLSFDYINCDEVLYLVPDPLLAMQAMKAVLKPGGILRANLHSALQRAPFYQSQLLFNLLGLTADNPGELEMDLVVETMQSLRDETRLKRATWVPDWALPDHRQHLLANYLLVGDKGFTIPDVFNLLDESGLTFLKMVNWRRWEVADLFKDPENLPSFWGFGLAEVSPREILQIYELLNPVHRLLDWWCTHEPEPDASIEAWSEPDWATVRVHLHPQLCHNQAKQELLHAIASNRPYEISRYVNLPAPAPVMLESKLAASLLPLWEAPQPVEVLAHRYLTISPTDPISLQSRSPEEALAQTQALICQLEPFLYLLLER